MNRFQAFPRHFLLALQGATRLPVAGQLARLPATGMDTPDGGAAHLPGVGLLVGAVAGVVFAAVSLPMPDSAAGALAAAFLSTIATVLLTGAVHEEGLARSVRHLGSHADVATRGTLALVLAIGTKVALLAVLASQSAAGVLAALLAGHAVSRFWPLVLRAAEAPAQRRGLVVGALWCLPALVLMALAAGPAFLLVPLVASALAFVVLVRRYRKRLRETGGDEPAAIQQVCELAFYLGAAFALRG